MTRSVIISIVLLSLLLTSTVGYFEYGAENLRTLSIDWSYGLTILLATGVLSLSLVMLLEAIRKLRSVPEG
ncbi:MAG: hypothetical protein HN542_00360 [Flavobacteriales bacterium]|jgi:hypothetical protein|nr:hypothetical protein [Flavobacteriales bacterium]NCG30137.1 hypothetical protein [Bacteroidota bacterium]MBT3963354.1 hypothetical protein [Flavobacteriales bacterium]MBT4704478.1 hypothetical protein [Flavobacteriales bacterium]MBT4931233.1 hypothetical protein [Flavobacteriales bacterium]